MNKLVLIMMSMLLSFIGLSQEVMLEGYVYEEGNRGYLNNARVLIEETISGETVGETFTDKEGYFTMDVDPNTRYTLHVTKDFFTHVDVDVSTKDTKAFVKVQMERDPGYFFEITLADEGIGENMPTDGVRNTRIEVYNNTTQESELVIENHTEPEFRVHLEQGNHYTILVRKKGYFAKKMEAFVNVNDCILCFEGVGRVGPGVSDNLTAGNKYGVLLANVEMKKVFQGQSVEIENLYYDTDKSFLRPDAKVQLDKVVTLLQYNPKLTVELGSHTDARASDEYNLKLSDARAKSAVDYLKKMGGIPDDKISSRGYGEQVILNECVNGVTCTDEEHQINRRTELKIVGIDDAMEFTPLAELKRREQLENLAINGQLGEQVSGEELQRILKAEQLEKTPNQNASDKEVEKSNTKALVDYKKINATSNDAKNATKPNVSANKPKVLNGVKVVLLEVDERITKDDELYEDHKDLDIFEKPNGKVWYILGGFATKEDALKAIENKLEEEHPGAFMVEFLNGKLVKKKVD